MKITTKLSSDEKVWNKMKQGLQRQDKEVDVGWWETMHPTGIPVAQVAALNEEGHFNGQESVYPGAYTPPRPFFSVDFRKYVQSIMPSLVMNFPDVIEGKISSTKFHQGIQNKLSDGLRQIIIDFDNPPNSPTTIKLKGTNDPLVDTGTMRDSIKTRVVPSKKK